MRVGGRLGYAACSFDAKHPVILPQNLSWTQLVIDQYDCHSVVLSGVNFTLNASQQRFFQNGKVSTRRAVAKCLVSAETQDLLNS